MSPHKIIGCCSLCDGPCFEIIEKKHDGEPMRLGAPIEGATRITFMLYDGTKTHLTFCGDCADMPLAEQFVELWRKNIRTWQRELGDKKPDWFLKQFENGILCEMGRKTWKALIVDG